MIRRPPRSTLDRSSAASDVYKRQGEDRLTKPLLRMKDGKYEKNGAFTPITWDQAFDAVSYTHLRAHETVLDLVCRLLLEKKKKNQHRYDRQSKNNTEHS